MYSGQLGTPEIFTRSDGVAKTKEVPGCLG